MDTHNSWTFSVFSYLDGSQTMYLLHFTENQRFNHFKQHFRQDLNYFYFYREKQKRSACKCVSTPRKSELLPSSSEFLRAIDCSYITVTIILQLYKCLITKVHEQSQASRSSCPEFARRRWWCNFRKLLGFIVYIDIIYVRLFGPYHGFD